MASSDLKKFRCIIVLVAYVLVVHPHPHPHALILDFELIEVSFLRNLEDKISQIEYFCSLFIVE